MGFFQRGGDEDAEHAQERERIEAGGIPLMAEERLRALGEQGSMFTSGLSVNEFALLDQLGAQPLAQVMGASVVRTGAQYLPPLAPGANVLVASCDARYARTNTGGAGWTSPYT